MKTGKDTPVQSKSKSLRQSLMLLAGLVTAAVIIYEFLHYRMTVLLESFILNSFYLFLSFSHSITTHLSIFSTTAQ
jgi:hypothetical protein